MKSEKGIICQGPVPYDGREGMFLHLSKRNKNLANLEEESEDDPRLLGNHISKELHLAWRSTDLSLS